MTYSVVTKKIYTSDSIELKEVIQKELDTNWLALMREVLIHESNRHFQEKMKRTDWHFYVIKSPCITRTIQLHLRIRRTKNSQISAHQAVQIPREKHLALITVPKPCYTDFVRACHHLNQDLRNRGINSNLITFAIPQWYVGKNSLLLQQLRVFDNQYCH